MDQNIFQLMTFLSKYAMWSDDGAQRVELGHCDSFKWSEVTLIQRRNNDAMSYNEWPTTSDYDISKHTIALFSLSDHYTLSREWRVIGDKVKTNYHGRPIWYYNQLGLGLFHR